ncbi:CLUMA_CG006355, isoform A [Clunio marinus]|uniref:CLUMA_CG006355, isoform A n=1 Tax=Clunio marinus TaxID=568069 RepID=A0A1J1HXJ7_9DIPT|nr:CLUMA_CG006355, isoform A [Clunio marinus]
MTVLHRLTRLMLFDEEVVQLAKLLSITSFNKNTPQCKPCSVLTQLQLHKKVSHNEASIMSNYALRKATLVPIAIILQLSLNMILLFSSSPLYFSFK